MKAWLFSRQYTWLHLFVTNLAVAFIIQNWRC